MPKIYGNHVCCKCGENIEWEAIIPQPSYSRYYEVVRYDSNKALANRLSATKMVVRCRSCKTLNSFSYNKE